MELFLQSLASLLAVAGPWRAAIVFGGRARALPPRVRRATAFYTVIISAVVGLVFILAGDLLLNFFRISDEAFLIGAGLIVIVLSVRRVIADEPELHPDLDDERSDPFSLAAYPLAIPLVITPPGIATLITLGVLADRQDVGDIVVIGAFLIVMGINLGVFLLESRYGDNLSPAIFQVAGRILGVLLVGFGVTVVIEGAKILGLVST